MSGFHPPLATLTSFSVATQVDDGGPQILLLALQAVDTTEETAKGVLGDVFGPFGAPGEGMGETDRSGILRPVEDDKRVGTVALGVPPLVQCPLHVY
jgi:hypothetical protein